MGVAELDSAFVRIVCASAISIIVSIHKTISQWVGKLRRLMFNIIVSYILDTESFFNAKGPNGGGMASMQGTPLENESQGSVWACLLAAMTAASRNYI